MKFKRVTWFLISCFMILMTFQLTGCGPVSGGSEESGDGGGATTSTVDQIILNATPSSLSAGGTDTSVITANAMANGNPVSNAQLRFEIDPNEGRLEGSALVVYKTADENGVASVTVSPPSVVGTSTVNVSTGNIANSIDISIEGPLPGRIDLSADRTSIAADGADSASIYAEVSTAEGDTLENIPVTFTIESGGGTFGNGTATFTANTNASGTAVAELTSAQTAGQAVVKATISRLSSTINIAYTLGSVDITIAPMTLLATGEDTATVEVEVSDLGGATADGTVEFSIDKPGLGTITPISTNLINGEATAIFQTKQVGGSVKITAKWLGPDDTSATSDDVEASETIVIQNPPAAIELATDFPKPATINIKGSGGVTTSLITLNVKDTNGNPVAEGYRIDFDIRDSDRPGGDEFLNPLFAITTELGKVTTTLSSGTKPGPVTIIATYHNNTNVTASISNIAIVAGNPVGEEFGVFAGYLNISGLSYANLEDPVTINAGDIYGNAIPDNTAISFKTYNTGGLFTEEESLTESGLSTNTLISTGTNPSPIEGFVFVTAEANNGGRTTHVTAIETIPGNSDYIYAATDGGGIYKSTDAGSSWRNITRSSTIRAQNIIDPYVNDIAVDPDEPNTVYAATGYLGKGNIYRSVDGGDTWNSNDTEEWAGILDLDTEVLSILCDDNGSDYLWAGTQGYGLVYSDDGGETFDTGIDLGVGRSVMDIVKEPGTSDITATLYAGTPSGVYKSTDGGANWARTAGNFIGSNISTLAHHPSVSGAVYAGTQDAGIWVTYDGGITWEQKISGLGKGSSASTPIADVNNVGDGVMSRATVFDGALNESWSFTWNDTADAFLVTGTVSGDQANYPVTDPATPYTIANKLEVTIEVGNVAFDNGDTFTFITTRDSGKEIKDVFVDSANNKLYALTYFSGATEPHAVGNVYRADLDASGNIVSDWVEAVNGLPVFDEDGTLYPQHVMAMAGSALYIGGEGINFSKATTGLDTGAPVWKTSKNGMTNLIMARMPILFTGSCDMDVQIYNAAGIRIDDRENDLALDEDFYFHITTMDSNGNPPIAGSEVTVTLKIDAKEEVIFSYEYSDAYTGPGTFPEWEKYSGSWPAWPATPSLAGESYNPHIISGKKATGYIYIFDFKPACNINSNRVVAPGCSGADQKTLIDFF